jgi:hypothetical protein
VFFLKKRSEAIDKFKYFKGIVEKEVGAEIKCLKTYQGGKFTKTKFNFFCEKHALKR